MIIKCIFFDMGNVLVYFSHDLMFEQMAEVADTTADDVRRILMTDGLQWQFERGELTEQQFHDAFCTAIDREVNFEQLKAAACEIFWPNTTVLPLLQSLKSQGLRLVLLSNTSISHLEFVQNRFNVVQYFDAFAVSFNAGVLKPERGIYQYALSMSGCLPGECFFVDDRDENILAARQMGIQAEKFTTADQMGRQLAKFGIKTM